MGCARLSSINPGRVAHCLHAPFGRPFQGRFRAYADTPGHAAAAAVTRGYRAVKPLASSPE